MEDENLIDQDKDIKNLDKEGLKRLITYIKQKCSNNRYYW